MRPRILFALLTCSSSCLENFNSLSMRTPKSFSLSEVPLWTRSLWLPLQWINQIFKRFSLLPILMKNHEESFWWLQCSISYVQSLSSPTSWDSSLSPIALLRRQHEVKTNQQTKLFMSNSVHFGFGLFVINKFQDLEWFQQNPPNWSWTCLITNRFCSVTELVTRPRRGRFDVSSALICSLHLR